MITIDSQYEMLQEAIERRERRGEDFKKSDLTWRKYISHNYFPNKIIDRFLRAYIDKPYSEFYKKVTTQIKKEDYYLIDYHIYRKNVNGEYVDSWGKVVNLINGILKTTGRASYREYYIEDGILRCNMPYRRFFKREKRKVIKKKEKPFDPLFKFDYDVVVSFKTVSIQTDVYADGKPRYTTFTVDQFKDWCERRKKTYRIDEKNHEFRRVNGKLTVINKPSKMHIKTSYDD